MLKAPLAFPSCQPWSELWPEMLHPQCCKVALLRSCEFSTQSRHTLAGRIFGKFTCTGLTTHGPKALRTPARNLVWLTKFSEHAIMQFLSGCAWLTCAQTGIIA